MNELLIENCAVVSSVFATILAQRMNQVGKGAKLGLYSKCHVTSNKAPHS
jgi:hypothetical protein